MYIWIGHDFCVLIKLYIYIYAYVSLLTNWYIERGGYQIVYPCLTNVQKFDCLHAPSIVDERN